MAAFELSLQYLIIRQDRSFHFVQLVTAALTLLFFAEVLILVWLVIVLPVVPYVSAEPFAFLHGFCSPMVAVLALIALLLTRASKTRFVIEPGEQTIERLNREILEPCLGVKFDTETGKLYSDHRQDAEGGLETFYSVRYTSEGGTPHHSPLARASSDSAGEGRGSSSSSFPREDDSNGKRESSDS